MVQCKICFNESDDLSAISNGNKTISGICPKCAKLIELYSNSSSEFTVQSSAKWMKDKINSGMLSAESSEYLTCLLKQPVNNSGVDTTKTNYIKENDRKQRNIFPHKDSSTANTFWLTAVNIVCGIFDIFSMICGAVVGYLLLDVIGILLGVIVGIIISSVLTSFIRLIAEIESNIIIQINTSNRIVSLLEEIKNNTSK